MSLDIYINLKTPRVRRSTGVYVRENGENKELTKEEVKQRYGQEVGEQEIKEDYIDVLNITHNLGTMADHVVITVHKTFSDYKLTLYEIMWRPDENGVSMNTSEMLDLLLQCYPILIKNKSELEQYNPENGWGTYDGLVRAVETYIKCCRDYPDCEIEVSR